MLAETVIAASITYLIMVAAVYWRRIRPLHVSIMVAVMIFDLLMPFYLYANRDWKTRLIDHGDILSFLVWTHFGLLIALFVLYGIQIMAGRKLLAGDNSARGEHKNVAKGILLTRALVILSGALLYHPEEEK
ncbi:MAG: hypothetical protein L0Z73_15375, partial [Gammaproteobacteria bacterium]|nr:hypothetical protein [Gammaproteobacteria bacterium]